MNKFEGGLVSFFSLRALKDVHSLKAFFYDLSFMTCKYINKIPIAPLESLKDKSKFAILTHKSSECNLSFKVNSD
jgi:hypothetical protein